MDIKLDFFLEISSLLLCYFALLLFCLYALHLFCRCHPPESSKHLKLVCYLQLHIKGSAPPLELEIVFPKLGLA